MTITDSPALLAIWTRRSRNFPVGMPETARRKFLPRLPREGRRPARSRPSARASAKSRSSITIARAPCCRAAAMRLLIAARSRPSRVAVGSPVRSKGMVAGAPAQQCLPAPHHGYGPVVRLPLYPAEPGLERLEPDGLGMTFRSGGVATGPARLLSGRDSKPRLDPSDAGRQAALLGAQVLFGLLVLVLAGACDRPGPPGRGLHSQRPLAHRTRDGLPLGVQPSLGAPHRQVMPGQRPQMPAGGLQYGLVLGGNPRGQGSSRPSPCVDRSTPSPG
jgi:hypothetical protein